MLLGSPINLLNQKKNKKIQWKMPLLLHFINYTTSLPITRLTSNFSLQF